jgi:hypothetical protein
LYALPTAGALAGDHVYDVSNPAYKSECASCHIAYPAQLLPAESWRTLMTGLNRHFGTDASVDAKAAADIGRFLEDNAGRRRGSAATGTPRISETAWFAKEHRKVQGAIAGNAAVKRAANCAACHSRADNGDFSERTLRLPR